jgi:hypothetical protein
VAGFDSLIRSGVALADSLTGSLQSTVTHEAWIGQDAYGSPSYAAPVARAALVEQRVAQARVQPSGEMVSTTAKVTFLRPIAPNGAAGRKEPVDTRDRITLQDGATGPLVNISNFIDKTTGRGYLTEVWLG